MEVFLHVYDISAGMAATMSGMILGRQIDGIWHTGVVVGTNEFFFGGGIIKLPPEEIERLYGMRPVKKLPFGKSEKTDAEIEAFLASVDHKFTPEAYDLLNWNCNHFSQAILKFVSGAEMPDYVMNQHELITGTPIGNFINHMMKRGREAVQHHYPGTPNPNPSEPPSAFTEGTRNQWVSKGDYGSKTDYQKSKEIPRIPPVYTREFTESTVMFYDCVNAVANGPAKDDMVKLLIRMGEHILHRATDARYRTVRLTARPIAEKVMPVTGGEECLVSLGFEKKTTEGGTTYEFPMPTAQVLKILLQKIAFLRSIVENPPPPFEAEAYPANVGNSTNELASTVSANASEWAGTAFEELVRSFVVPEGMQSSITGNQVLPSLEAPTPASFSGFEYQLEQLAGMGFTDTEACIRVLREVNGNINAALDRLLQSSSN